jgi:hypothetical protein
LLAAAPLSFGQEMTQRLSLESQLSNAKKKLANTWYVDRVATSLYVKKHLAADDDAVDNNRMLKQFADVALRFTADGTMRIVTRDDLTNELHQSSFVLTVDDDGNVYLIGHGEGTSSVFSLSFDGDQLVLSRNRNPKPSECSVFITKPATR